MGSSEVMVGLKGLWSTVVEVAGFALYPVEVGPKAMVESVGFVLASFSFVVATFVNSWLPR